MAIYDLRTTILEMIVIDENDVIAKATYRRTVLGFGSIKKIGVCQMANKSRDLRAHAMLSMKRLMWVSL